MNKQEIAWATGLFEGEGCVRKGTNSVQAIVTSTDLDVLEQFSKFVGFGKIGKPQARGSYKPLYQWRVSSFEKVQALMAMFWPYLGSRRREAFMTSLEGVGLPGSNQFGPKKYKRVAGEGA